MTSPRDSSATLDAVRAEIDRIDATLHELMIERTALARDVWKAKERASAGLAAIRPAREAQMLRAFARRHSGEMSLPVLWRIWRELIVANIRAQSPLAVHVANGGRGDEVWDLARAHFGFDTAMTRHDSAPEAVRAAAAEGAVAILSATEAWAWGPDIADGPGIHVYDALPQILSGAAAPGAYLAGDVALEPSGEDVTLVLLRAGRDEAAAAARGQGLAVAHAAAAGEAALLGIAGFAACGPAPGHARWGDRDVLVLGGHPAALVFGSGEASDA